MAINEKRKDYESKVNPDKRVYKKILVIIPAYNEEKNIKKVIEGVKKNLLDADILIVDDFSSDKTFQIAKKNGAIVLRHPFNMGYASSCQSGFKFGLEKGYEITIQIDADGQHSPESIHNVLLPITNNEADLCIGSRFLGNYIYKTSVPRKIGMFLFSKIASILTRKKITDPTSGFQTFNSKVLKLYCTDVYPTDYPDANLIIMMHFAGFRIKEVPVIMFPNPEKSMHNFFSSVFYVIKMTLSIFVSLFTKTFVLNKIKEQGGQ